MLTLKQKELLIGTTVACVLVAQGSLLGDTHLEYNGKNCRARFDHCIAQLEYLQWKQKMLEPYSTPISQYTIFDKRTQKTYKKARFYTYTLPCATSTQVTSSLFLILSEKFFILMEKKSFPQIVNQFSILI